MNLQYIGGQLVDLDAVNVPHTGPIPQPVNPTPPPPPQPTPAPTQVAVQAQSATPQTPLTEEQKKDKRRSTIGIWLCIAALLISLVLFVFALIVMKTQGFVGAMLFVASVWWGGFSLFSLFMGKDNFNNKVYWVVVGIFSLIGLLLEGGILSIWYGQTH